MKKRQTEKREKDNHQIECEIYHVVYTEKYGPLLVKFPPEFTNV